MVKNHLIIKDKIMKNLFVLCFIALLITLSTIKVTAQDLLFAGPTFRIENTAIGINAGIKKDFGNFGAMAQIAYYPYRLETDNSIVEGYLTYADFNLVGLYNFYLDNNLTVYPLAGLAINSSQSKTRVKSILEPEIERDFSKGKRQSTVGATFGVGATKQVGKFNLIGDFRFDATAYSTLKLFIGIAYKFSTVSKAKQ